MSEEKTNIPAEPPVLLFDGVCNLCNAAVQWVLLRDRRGLFRFAALQSEVGKRLLREHGMDTENIDTVVLVQEREVFLRSDAALEIAWKVGGFWRIFYIFKIVPRFLRDVVYDFVARNRYRWFGRQAACMLPRPEWSGRFL